MPLDTPISVRLTINPADMEKALTSAVRRCEAAANKMEKSLGGIGKGVTQGAQQTTQSIKGTTLAATNLSYQLNDISVSLVGGQSPFMIMMQQGAQVSQIFNQLSASGASMGTALVGAFKSMLSPMALVSYAVIALAGYTYQYFTAAEDGGKEAAKALKEQLAAMDGVISHWGDMLATLRAVRQAQIDIADDAEKATQTEIAVQEQWKKLRKEVQGGPTGLFGMFDEAVSVKRNIAGLVQGLQSLENAQAGAVGDEVNAAWVNFDNKVTAGTATMKDLARLTDAMAKAKPWFNTGVDDAIRQLLGLEPAIKKATRLTKQLRDENEAATSGKRALVEFTKQLDQATGKEADKVAELRKEYQKQIDALDEKKDRQEIALKMTLALIDAERELEKQAADKEAKKVAEALKEEAQRQKEFNDELQKMNDIAAPALTNMQKLLQQFLDTLKLAKTTSEGFQSIWGLIGNSARLGWQAASEGVEEYKGDVLDLTETLRKEEGKEPALTPYMDHNAITGKNAGYRIGYGSDTYTPAGTSQQLPVTADTRISKAEADANLTLRAMQQINEQILPAIGSKWNEMNDEQKKAILSLSYNYTHAFPKSVAEIIKAGGSPAEVARAINALPANPARRQREAEQFASGTPGDPLAVQKMTTNLQQNNEELRKEMELKGQLSAGIDQVVAARERDLEILRLTTEAKKKAAEENRTELTKEETAAIREQATERGNLLGAMSAWEAKQKLLTESTQAQTKALQDQKAASNQLIDQYASMASTAISTFIIDLKNGVSAGEAFRNMINNLIDELIRMAVQMLIIKPLFDSLKGVGGFNVATASPGLFKGGGTIGVTGNPSAKVSPAMFAGARSMAGGGVIGDPNAIPIIGHRGEVVIPRSAMNKASFQTRQSQGDHVNVGPTSIKIDVANGGGTNVTQASSAAFGQLVDRTVQSIIVRESKPGGLLRQGQGVR